MLFTKTLWRLCLLGVALARPHSPHEADQAASELEVLPTPLNSTNPAPPSSESEWPHHLHILNGRAPNDKPKPDPLLTPDDVGGGRGRAKKHENFMKTLLNSVRFEADENIPIIPSDRQLQTWVIDGIVIGVTSYWYPWPKDKKTTYKMQGLTGCTATIAMSEEGFWAAHHWESIKEDNQVGGSSFNVRLPGSSKIQETPDDIFQKIAVDILTETTPVGERGNREFISLTDLKEQRGNPFGVGSNVDVFVLTKATGPKDPSPRYGKKIKLLEEGYKKAIPDCSYHQDTYVGDTKLTEVSADLRGSIVIQYTPFEKVDKNAGNGNGDDCGKIAKAMIWVENKTKPMVTKEWETE